jgi:pilus assembly protein Flp/PilA
LSFVPVQGRPAACASRRVGRDSFFGGVGLSVVTDTLLEEAMKNLALKVQRFLVSEDGPTAVEYAVMLALIIIVCLTAIQAIGTNANATFQSVAAKLPAGAVAS